MTDPLAPPPSDAVAYRPLSGLALAGFGVSLIFTVVVLINAGIGLARGIPFFFPMWVLLIAGVGVVLSLLGQRQIDNSEGTRAGLALARAGFWLGLFSGLGYFAYYFGTSVAITNQANTFLTATDPPGFFELLEKSSTDPVAMRAAFLLTLPATQRGSFRPEDPAIGRILDAPQADGSPGKLTVFRQSFLARAFGKGVAGKVRVDPLGGYGWSYENGSYKVTRSYRLSSPELEMEVRLPVQSTEGESAGKMRDWFVLLFQAERSKVRLTPLGTNLAQLRKVAAANLAEFMEKVNRGQPWAEPVKDIDWNLAPEAYREVIRDRLTQMLKGNFPDHLPLSFTEHDGIGNWQYGPDGTLQILFPFQMKLPPEGPSPPLLCEGAVVCQAAVNPSDDLAQVDMSKLSWYRSLHLTRIAVPESKKKS